MTQLRNSAMFWYLAALLVLCAGMGVAAARYPGGYDWIYTVISALASQKHNPEGCYWFSVALALSMSLLWVSVTIMKRGLGQGAVRERAFVRLVQLAIVAAFLIGIERFFFYDISSLITHLHEVFAVIAFFAFYVGILGLLAGQIRRRRLGLLPLLLVAVPIVVVGAIEFWLYLAQREIGWVDVDWRAREIHVWLSFALWQWLQLAFIWLGLGVVVHTLSRERC